MNTQTFSGNKYRWIFLGITLICLIITYWYTFDTKLALLGDNASYYTLGKALANGEGFVNISRISKSPNNHYPPGYPALISAVLVFSDSIVVVKILSGLFLFGSLIIGYLLLARLTESYILAFVASMFIVFNSHLLFYGSLMMSEVPYMFFSLLALYLFSLVNFERLKTSAFYIVGMLLSMIVAYYVRSLGVALLAGFCLYFLISKNWKMMGISILSMVAGGLPWFIRGQSLGGTSYMNQLKMINPYNPALGEANFGDFVDRFWSNFSRYVTREIPDVMFNYGPAYNQPTSGKEWLIGLVFLVIIGFGLTKLNHFRWLIIGYILGTLGILMIWPDVWIGVRFIVPVAPIFILGFLNGFYHLFKMIRKQQQLSVAVLYSPLVLLVFLISPLQDLHTKAKKSYPVAWQRYFEVAEWLKKNEENVVISCGKPSLFYTYADNYTMRYKFTKNTDELLAHLEKQQVDYVVIDQVYGNTFQYLLPAVRQHPERFQQVLHLKNPDTFLLKFKR